jgi:aromatic-amino-acid transaminase
MSPLREPESRQAMLFDQMKPASPDTLMEAARLFRADSREEKIDLGVGTYRDEQGNVPIMVAVKLAEHILLAGQQTKTYLTAAGDENFRTRFREAIFPDVGDAERLVALQTPGGTGALRLAMEIVKTARPDAHVIIGTPTWPNHLPLLRAARLSLRTYDHYERQSGEIDFEAMRKAIHNARAGDIILLHGCCHNPTGASFSLDHWIELADLLGETGVVPLIDLAYPGMAHSISDDAAGARLLLDRLPEVMVALSCSKIFSLYRERAGMLLVRAASAERADVAGRSAEVLARLMWSNPPAHGAEIVSLILAETRLRAEWHNELDAMRQRVREMRMRLGTSDVGPDLTMLTRQEGLFALLPLSRDAVDALRSRHSVYVDASGRMNIAGLNDGNIERFLVALQACARI